eukprot:c30215_g1_i1 orf=68-286(+)
MDLLSFLYQTYCGQDEMPARHRPRWPGPSSLSLSPEVALASWTLNSACYSQALSKKLVVPGLLPGAEPGKTL